MKAAAPSPGSVRARRICRWLPLVLVPLLSGCVSGILAQRLVKAPNQQMPGWEARVPDWEALQAQSFHRRFTVTAADGATLAVGVVDPAQLGFIYTLRFRDPAAKGGRADLILHLEKTLANAPKLDCKGTVVALHGIYMQKETLLPWAYRLSEQGYRVVLVDLRGHGASTGARISFGQRETDDLRRVLDELEQRGERAGDVAVFGVSYGAAIGLQWAAEDPRVKTLVLLEPYADVSRAVIRVARGGFGGAVKGVSDETFHRALRRAQREGGFEWSRVDVAAAARRLRVPVLFFHGGNDTWVAPEDSATLHALVPAGSVLQVTEDDDHLTLPLRVNELAPEMTRWLDHHLAARSVLPPPIESTVATH